MYYLISCVDSVVHHSANGIDDCLRQLSIFIFIGHCYMDVYFFDDCLCVGCVCVCFSVAVCAPTSMISTSVLMFAIYMFVSRSKFPSYAMLVSMSDRL